MRYLDLEHISQPQTPLRPQHRRRPLPRWLKFLGLVALLSGLVYGAYALFWPASATLADIFKAPAAVLSFIRPPEEGLKSANGRTNILLLGVDYRKDMSGEDLTDTMMVASIDTQSKTKDVVLISIPRDLWVLTPGWTNPETKAGKYPEWAKINAANAFGDTYDYPSGAGLGAAREVVQQVLGIPIHYVVRVNFYGFKQIVDALGGISVNVDTAFTDYAYPVEGQEKYGTLMTVSFKKGYQYMNGEQALEFARSRHGNNGEGSDLARAKRQQKILVAIRDKALNVQTLADPPKVSALIKLLGDNITTLDVDFSQIGQFYKMGQLIEADTAENVVLTDSPQYNPDGTALLAVDDSNLYGGAFVFIPRIGQGKYQEIQLYVARKLAEAPLPKEASSSAQPANP